MFGSWKGRSPVFIVSSVTVIVLLVIVTMMMTTTEVAQAYPRLRRSPTPAANERPDLCVDDAVYVRCFMCGRLADDVRIYRECCRGNPEVDRFCEEMLI